MTNRDIMVATVLGLCFGCSTPTTTEKLNLTIPKSYLASKTQYPISIDGLANEAAWNDTKWTDLFMDIQGPDLDTPYYDTRVKMLWDMDYLYIYAKMEDEHVWGDIEQRDAVIFYNNDFEVFIKPNEFQPYYVEFEINALGTLWDLFLARPYRRNGPVLDEWDVKGTKIGIDIQGTLNNPKDIDDGWSVELAIPIAPINAIDRGHTFGEGSVWRVNFSRVQWDYQLNGNTYEKRTDNNGRRLPENNWVWSPQMAIDMHRPEHWGYVFFIDNPVDSTKNTYLDQSMTSAYQLLFHLYRKQLALQNNTSNKSGSFLVNEDSNFEVNGYFYDAEFLPTNLGFEIILEDRSGTKLSINQDGYIRSSYEK
tara:strand:+ start:7961 stop:9055 length:1095 start_codon:yes stop_codon:yes gene_type:complete